MSKYTIPDAPDAYIRGLLMLHQIRPDDAPPQKYVTNSFGHIAFAVDEAKYDAAPAEWADALEACGVYPAEDSTDTFFVDVPGSEDQPECGGCREIRRAELENA